MSLPSEPPVPAAQRPVKPSTRVLRVLLVVGLVGVAAVGIWWLTGEKQPSYEGRSLDSWLAELETVRWRETNAPAMRALRAMGTNAVPRLVEDVLTVDPSLMRDLRRRYSRIRGQGDGYPPDAQLRRRAARALEILGTNAAPALPMLIQAVKKGRGQDGVPWIGISAIVGNVEATIPTITNELSDPPYRGQAAFFLSRYVRNPEASVPFLMQCSQDTNAAVRLRCLIGLKEFGLQAAAAEDLVRGLLEDPDPDVADQAAVTLEAITRPEPAEP